MFADTKSVTLVALQARDNPSLELDHFLITEGVRTANSWSVPAYGNSGVTLVKFPTSDTINKWLYMQCVMGI